MLFALLRATQINYFAHLTPCAKQSHLARVAFAVAKAAQFLLKVKCNPLTQTSNRSLRSLGLSNAARLPAPVVGVMALGGLAFFSPSSLCNSDADL